MRFETQAAGAERSEPEDGAAPVTPSLGFEGEAGAPGAAITAGAAVVSEPRETTGTGAPPAGEQWREEVSSRIERFRQRRRAQATLPLEFDENEALDFEPASNRTSAKERQPASRQGKIIPFEQIRAKAITLPPSETRAQQPSPAGCASEKPVAPPAVPAGLPAVSAPSSAQPAPEAASPVVSAAKEPRLPASNRLPSRRVFAAPAGAAVQGSLAFPESPPCRQLSPIEDPIEFPAAPVAARVLSAVFDAGVVALSCALFLGIFAGLGGRFSVQRTGMAAIAAALALLAGVYLFLFLFYAAATPGMRWLGLRLVDFEGSPARPGQRLLRVLAIVPSSAALGFGFLWAAFDEEALAWHDRISRTCLTISGSPVLKAKRRDLLGSKRH